MQAEALQTDRRLDSGPATRNDSKIVDGPVEEGLPAAHNRTTGDEKPLTLSQMVPDESPTNCWDERGFRLANLESDSVENISSVQRGESDISFRVPVED